MTDNPFDDEREKTYQQIEFKIHCAIVEQLPTVFPFVTFWHTPNRGAGGKDGHFKQMMGAKKGVSDLGLSWNHGIKYQDGMTTPDYKLECGWYEVKAPGRKLETSQNKWFSTMHAQGWRTAWGTSVKHAFDTFESWGCIRKSRVVVEPDIRTEQKKFADSFDFFRP